MHAVLLAGGVGTRLKPYTTIIPKPLMPVGGMPIMEIILRQLARDNFKEVTITLGYLGKLIESYFGNGSQLGIRITYSYETTPLGTMGPLKLIRELPENFLVMNGDILTDLSFINFYKNHLETRKIFSVSTYYRKISTELGILDIDNEGNLIGFREKPKLGFHVSMGIYMANKQILDHIPDNCPFGFDQLMRRFIELKNFPYIYHHEGYWLDIGRTEDYNLAQEDFDKIQQLL